VQSHLLICRDAAFTALGNKIAFPNLMRFNGAAPEGEHVFLASHTICLALVTTLPV
jgi:hypothetical protein